MSIGSWEPTVANDETPYKFDHQQLQAFIDLSRRDAFDEVTTLIPEDQRQAQSRMMRLPKEAWFSEAEHFNADELTHLVRFYTRAEMLLPDWDAGADSPVVWLVKVLRKRGTPPSKELLQWIKANSDNKFIPNGAL